MVRGKSPQGGKTKGGDAAAAVEFIGPGEPISGSASAMPTLALTAHRLHPMRMPVVVGTAARDWMDATPNRFAYRCLPMLIANQAGWYVITQHSVAVTWDGTEKIEGLKVECLAGELPCPAISTFGSGILTWTMPYLFRTPPGYNLLVRGPANWPKDGIAPLEGIVETDWTESTFTMNWKLTRPDHTVTFNAGEPIAMIVPQPRGELELFRPEIRDIASHPELHEAYEKWAELRRRFNEDLHKVDSDARKQGWQKHYAQGKTVTEARSREHQSKLALHAFVEEKASAPPVAPGGPSKAAK
jgi:hypothetical protein